MLRSKMLSVLAGVTLVLIGIDGLEGIEVGVPERFLRPRDYNPHPFQTLLASGQPLNVGAFLDRHAYQLYSRPRPRPAVAGGGDSSPVQFPAVPEAAQPRQSSNPGYITVPNNYAFSYAVKDRQSGDDFSHQQAQNGEATKGEYRVKLPDGRTQIVSYTADNSGYKADVRYDGIANQPSRPTSGNVYYRPSSSGYGALTNSILQDNDADYPEEAPEVVYRQPVRLLHKQNALANQYVKATPTPRPVEVLFSPTPQPYKSLGHAPLSYQPVQFRALPQTAAEYTSSDAPYYAPVAAPTPTPFYGGSVSSTPATPIMEDQDDVPAPRKPAPISSYYSSSTRAPPPSAVRYVLVPHHSAQYDYSDS